MKHIQNASADGLMAKENLICLCIHATCNPIRFRWQYLPVGQCVIMNLSNIYVNFTLRTDFNELKTKCLVSE